MLKRVAMATVAALAVTAAASAQTSGSTQSSTSATKQTPTTSSQPSSTTSGEDVRPATTTPMGDTGLWFVPTGEVLPHKKWSASAYRTNFDYQQGFADVSNWP